MILSEIPDITIATEQDIDGIYEVEKNTWIQTYPSNNITKEDIEQRFNNEFKQSRCKEILNELKTTKHSYRIIKEGNKIIAYSHLLRETDFNDLVELYVLPQYQKKGIGTILMKDALEWFGDTKPIRLEVATYNIVAIAFYKQFGFHQNTHLYQSVDEKWNILPSGTKIPVIFMERLPLS